VATDYYQVLGLERSASADEIKKAFRKKAHEFHPDKGGDAEQFKLVNEAYQTLSDPQKREQYDRFGSAGPQGMPGGGFGFDYSGFSGGGFGDIFGDIFSAAFANVQAEVQVSIAQAVLGETLSLRVQGEAITLTLPPGTQDGQAFRFPGKGQPFRGGKGDLTLVVRVAIPRRLSKEQKQLFEKLRALD